MNTQKQSRAVPTFADAADRELEVRRNIWRNPSAMERRWRSTLARHVNPVVGAMPVCDVTLTDVVRVLARVQSQYPRLVPRVRKCVSAVLRWAVAQGFRGDDPASAEGCAGAFGPHPASTPFSALPHAQVPGALARVRACDAWVGTRLLLEFQVLTAVRPGEARNALWSELDHGAARWSVPAERTRQYRRHDVPLSSAALAVLEAARASEALRAARARGGCPELVFPSQRGRPLGHAVARLLRQLGIETVGYGFRTSFRAWCADAGIEPRIANTCLALVRRDEIVSSLIRPTFYTQRVAVMEAWSQFVQQGTEHAVDPFCATQALPGEPRVRGGGALIGAGR